MIHRFSALAASLLIGACATVETPTFQSDDFNVRAAHHESVAILPFAVTIIADPEKLPEDVTEQDLRTQEKEEAYVYQQQLYSALLEQSQEVDFTVKLQDVSDTNVTLERHEVEYPAIHESYSKREIAEMLQVDSVISGSLSRARTMSTEGAVATSILTTIISAAVTGGTGYATVTPNTIEVNTSVAIHDGEDGALLWNLDVTGHGGPGSSPQGTAEELMPRFAKIFPYVAPESEGEDQPSEAEPQSAPEGQ